MGAILVLARPASLPGQEATDVDRAKVFLDCQSSGCDFDFFRRETTWVDWVRDRVDADVHVLVTATGAGGGISYRIDFLGLRAFEGEGASLTFLSSSTDTPDERREALAERIHLGLARYAAATSAVDGLRVEFTEPSEQEGRGQAGAPADDPWDLWVFTVRFGGSYNGQSGVTGTSVNGSLTASRTSEAWKLRLGNSVNYNENEYEFDDGDQTQVITSISRTLSTSGLLVRSLGPHWGLGGNVGLSSSTYSNYDMRLTLQPAVEYDIFPYSESSRRSFTFQYRIGPQFVRYDEQTVFGKTRETLVDHSLTAELGLRQPWGTASISLQGVTLVNDPKKNRVSVFGSVNLRIVRGLSLSLFGSASRVRDQINLPARGATQDQVLLQRRILETDFTSYMSVSLSYTFGSIFNNIVNPRFDGGVLF